MKTKARNLPLPGEWTPGEASPLTGAYYWVPRPEQGGMSWDLVTCYDLNAWAAISHREFWPLILELLAKDWDKDVKALDLALNDHHAGLPRGRITRPQTGYIVIHGDDAPVGVPIWLKRVKTQFGLTQVKVKPEYTEHERMLRSDHQAVEAALGFSLFGRTTA